MSKADNTDDLSMEEILASVRQIVSENPGKTKPTSDFTAAPQQQPFAPTATPAPAARQSGTPAPSPAAAPATIAPATIAPAASAPAPTAPVNSAATTSHFDGLSDLIGEDQPQADTERIITQPSPLTRAGDPGPNPFAQDAAQQPARREFGQRDPSQPRSERPLQDRLTNYQATPAPSSVEATPVVPAPAAKPASAPSTEASPSATAAASKPAATPAPSKDASPNGELLNIPAAPFVTAKKAATTETMQSPTNGRDDSMSAKKDEFFPPNMRQPTWARVKSPDDTPTQVDTPATNQTATPNPVAPDPKPVPTPEPKAADAIPTVSAQTAAVQDGETTRHNLLPHFSADSWPLAPEPPNALVEPPLDQQAQSTPNGADTTPDALRANANEEVISKDVSFQGALGEALAATAKPAAGKANIEATSAVEAEALSLTDLATPLVPNQETRVVTHQDHPNHAVGAGVTDVDGELPEATAPLTDGNSVAPEVRESSAVLPTQDQAPSWHAPSPTDNSTSEPAVTVSEAVSPLPAQEAGAEELAASATAVSRADGAAPADVSEAEKAAVESLAAEAAQDIAPAVTPTSQPVDEPPRTMDILKQGSLLAPAALAASAAVAAVAASGGQAEEESAAATPQAPSVDLTADQASVEDPVVPPAAQPVVIATVSEDDVPTVPDFNAPPSSATPASVTGSVPTSELPDASPLEFLARGLAASSQSQLAASATASPEPTPVADPVRSDVGVTPVAANLSPVATEEIATRVTAEALQADAISEALQSVGAASGTGNPATDDNATNERTMEDVVAGLLRPMLQQWLSDNMPRIIEKALRVEVETLNDKKTN